MVMNIFRRRRGERTIEALYGVIVAQARDATFYERYGVPDTVEGRFDMIVVHLALVTRRLRAEAEQGQAQSQALFDTFCLDMDHNLREMGVGDMAVPKRMKRFGEAFYGRAAAYDQALDEVNSDSGAGLVRAVGRNLFSDEEHAGAGPLAAYMRKAERALADAKADDIIRGAFRFPEPADGLRSGEQ